MSSDGKVHIFDEDGHETTQSMIFEFSGDDDMWIYIDKDLCLDVGGTHPAKPGNINFDKSVMVENVLQKHLKAMEVLDGRRSSICQLEPIH